MLRTLVVLLVGLGCPARAAADRLEDGCRTLITARLGTWTIASIAPDVAAWARTERFDPTIARPDFDGDGRPDVALLVQAVAKPVERYPERIEATRIAVCLDRPAGIELRVIDDPYCGDYISRARKGGRYFDFERARRGVYPSDGVTVGCFEKASATYVLDGAGFRMIVDGD